MMKKGGGEIKINLFFPLYVLLKDVENNFLIPLNSKCLT